MIKAFLVHISYHTIIPLTFYCLLLLVFTNYANNGESLDKQQKIVHILCSRGMKALYYLPISATLLSLLNDMISRQRKLSKIYNVDGKIIEPPRRRDLPFLPDAEHTPKEEWDKTYETLKKEISRQNIIRNTTGNEANTESFAWALVTGASRGIGRAIAVELARLRVPLILVARDKKKLVDLSTLLQECYGVPTRIITCDFGQPNAAQELYDATCKAKYKVDILISNAGIAETKELIAMDMGKIDQLVNVNVMTPSKLCQLYGRDMKDRKRGRILMMSSLTGAVPGVPTSAVYAATKAYQRSLTTSLRKELEPHGIGITCVIPGAVKETNFAEIGKMKDSFVWDFPLVTLTPDTVASASVKAMIVGYQEVIVGWLNTILVKVALHLLPARMVLMICECAWRPSPLRALSSKKEATRKKSHGEDSQLLDTDKTNNAD